jgi:hypothetical protein
VGAREDRIARNEALFRSVNERVRELVTNAGSRERDPVASFVCECGSADCTATIEMTVPEYENVRADPTHFVVVSGHEIPEVEEVVERHEHYDVVRKHAAEAQIAIETDPRSTGR